METQIIYGSQYGAAKRYAHRMAERTGIPMIPYDKAEDLTECSTIIYIGGLYAGGVLGLARTMRNPNFKPKRWFLITVGVSDPQDEETRRAIREQLQKQIPQEWFSKAQIFHLRGALDYEALKPSHRILMSLLYHRTKKQDAETLSAEDRAFLETYQKKVDFVDLNQLEPILEQIQNEL